MASPKEDISTEKIPANCTSTSIKSNISTPCSTGGIAAIFSLTYKHRETKHKQPQCQSPSPTALAMSSPKEAESFGEGIF